MSHQIYVIFIDNNNNNNNKIMLVYLIYFIYGWSFPIYAIWSKSYKKKLQLNNYICSHCV